MAEIEIVRASGTLACLGLGSCIGLCLFDPQTKVAGMAHIMLPAAHVNKPVDKLGKFADTGVGELMRQMERAGARHSRLVAAYVGGAQVFSFGTSERRLDIGLRNADAVSAHLKAQNIRVLGTDVGGNAGRTVSFAVPSGEIRVRTVAQGEKVLCHLAS
jgi:chemotaxis protein CheD